MRPGVIALCLFAALSVRADRVSDWRNDIASLVADLHRLHPRFRTCGVSPEIRAAAATLSERVPSLTDEQIAVEVQGLLALAGDGHTLLWPSGMKRLPV